MVNEPFQATGTSGDSIPTRLANQIWKAEFSRKGKVIKKVSRP